MKQTNRITKIRVSARESARLLRVFERNRWPGYYRLDRVFYLTDEQVEKVRQEGIQFKVLPFAKPPARS
jgi:hypothetical protein